jgi:ribosomal protein L21E
MGRINGMGGRAMTVKIMQEITEWKDIEFRQPNHVYLMDGDKVYAYSKWGQEKPQYMKTFLRIDRRGRKFVEAKKNTWKFDLDISVEPAVETKPQGQIWTVPGSKGNSYTVNLDSGRWSCTCPGHGFRGRCRHVDEIRITQS